MAWDFDKMGEKAKSLGAITATASVLLGGLLSGAWYVFSLEGRLRTVEAQIQAIAISSSAKTSAAADGNPLVAACTELASRAALAYQSIDTTGSAPARGIEDLMDKMGCLRAKAPRP